MSGPGAVRGTEELDPLVAKLRSDYPHVDVAEIERICARGRALMRPQVRRTLGDAVEWYARARLSLLRSGENVDEVVTLMSALRRGHA